jgi:HlyD family secretion protein
MSDKALLIAGDVALDPALARAPSLRGNVIAGIAAIGLGFGGFLVWGFTAHLDSAAIASGTVIVAAKAKTVSHLEGGILKEMLVKEGQFVHAGEPLLRLDDTKALSDLRQLEARRIGFLAKVARLKAEQAEADHIDFPPELTGSADEYVRQILRNEQQLFDRRRDTLERTIGAQKKQADAYAADAQAAAAQLAANADQQKLMKQQVDAIQSLVDKGIATRAQLADLQSRYSQLVSEAGALIGTRTHAEEGKAQTEVEIAKSETAWQSDVADQLQSTQIDLGAIEDNISAARDVLKRVVVTSPEDGIVTNIQYRTPGGVIAAGQPILDIVPDQGEKIIEAKLDPRDIDSVHLGARVQVRLTAYGTKQLPPLDGTLTYVAADQSVDERTSAAYYVVRAAVADSALPKSPKITLNAGEPADLMILNRPRLAIDYIVSPFTDSMHKAFHEE